MGIVAPVQMSWRLWPWHDKVWYRCCILEGKLYPSNFWRLGSFNDYDEYDVWLCAGFPSGRGGLSDEALLRQQILFFRNNEDSCCDRVRCCQSNLHEFSASVANFPRPSLWPAMALRISCPAASCCMWTPQEWTSVHRSRHVTDMKWSIYDISWHIWHTNVSNVSNVSNVVISGIYGNPSERVVLFKHSVTSISRMPDPVSKYWSCRLASWVVVQAGLCWSSLCLGSFDVQHYLKR
jgi:hypothetical protein